MHRRSRGLRAPSAGRHGDGAGAAQEAPRQQDRRAAQAGDQADRDGAHGSDEARGRRESAYRGRYTVTGTHIDYVDDTGFTADGTFVDGVRSFWDRMTSP